MITANTPAAVPSHILGYPRIGDKRQTKFALEHYWQGKKDKLATQAALLGVFNTNIQDHSMRALISSPPATLRIMTWC